MKKKDYSGRRLVCSYQLSPGQLADLHKKYGRPGEISPGKQAPKKRRRLDTTPAAIGRKDKEGAVPISEEGQQELDLP